MLGEGMTIGGALSMQAKTRGDDLFMRCDNTSWSFAALDDRATTVALSLAGAGIGCGDRVALLTPNRTEMAELYFALAKLGAVQVPLNAFLKGEFLRYQLADSEAVALVCDQAGLHAAVPLLRDLPNLQLVVTLDEDTVPDDVARKQLRYDALAAARANGALPEVAPTDVMSVVYTSGTTGFPKGCVLTHAYYERVGRRMVEACEITSDDVLFTALPLFHGAARMMVVAAGLLSGAVTVVEPVFRPAEFFARAAETGATLGFGVGAMGMALLAQPPGPADRAHRMRTMMLVPFPEAQQHQFRERFGTDAWAEVYGQTECVPASYSAPTGERRRATAGRPAPDLEVRLLDDDDIEVPLGAVGEISIRPRHPHAMFRGYWHKDHATASAFRSLWYHTGDFGRMDADGRITFVDRKKDALRRRGENVSSMELEAALVSHPAIAEVAVHAVPSEFTEDDIKACLVLAPGASIHPPAFFEFCKAALPYYAIPRYVEVLDELPKNAVGRVMKYQLRERPTGPDVWDLEALGLSVSKAERR